MPEIGTVLAVVAGPTGTGKTALSVDLAMTLRDRDGRAVEIVNGDAMQLYRGMDIGTAKATPAERRGVPHHGFDLLDVTEQASIARYRDAARTAIEEIESRGARPILVGGSGLYLEALLRDFRLPGTDAALRAQLEAEAERLGGDGLWRRLASHDPAAAAAIPAGNVRRVVRALEVVTLTGSPYAASLPTAAPDWRRAVRLVLDTADAPLRERLRVRAERMWAGGLLEEVRGLLAAGLRDGVTARRAIGYAQAVAVIDGAMTREEGLAETVRLTWRMVRRQRTWFARDVDAIRLDAADPDLLRRVVAAVDLADSAGAVPGTR